MDQEAAELFKPIEVGEMDTAADIAKKWNERLPKMQAYFTKQASASGKAVEEKFETKRQEDENLKIREFAKTHPEMKMGSEVVKLMEQLYVNGSPLEEAYKKACKANDLAPIAIAGDKTINLITGKEVDETGKEKEVESKASSLRSDTLKAATDDVDDGELKKAEPKTIRQAAEANLNAILAEHGNPWKED